MSEPIVRFFVEPRVCVFRLSPLYAEPGWYGIVDRGGTIGPYENVDLASEAAGGLIGAAAPAERPA